MTETRQKIRLKNSWNWLVILSPATVSQILDMTPCNHRKRIWCKSADMYLKNSWNWPLILSLATVSQILNMTLCNHHFTGNGHDLNQWTFVWKNLWKHVKYVNLFFGGFQPFGTTVCLYSLLTADYCVSRRPSTLFAHFWNLSSSGRLKPAIFAVDFAWMPHT